MICDGQFINQELNYSVIFDDNGRVAYAYLLNPDNKIVGDVWLYNRCVSPKEPEWKTPEKMPFANPEKFSKSHDGFIPVKKISEVSVEWGKVANEKVEAKIFIRNELYGVLLEGEKPGRAFLACKNGPLAKVIESK